MAISYAAAMKMYFQSQGKPVSFPKKGSAEHAAIRALMASGDIAGGSGVSAQIAKATGEVKPKKVKAAKSAPPPTAAATIAASAPAKPENTTLIDQPHVTKKALEEVKEDAAKPPPKKRGPKRVQSDGLTPQQNLLNKDAVENSSMKVAPAAFPDLKSQLEKVLEKVPEGVAVKKERKPRISKTLESNSAPDMKAVEGERAAFSFAAIRQLLRQ